MRREYRIAGPFMNAAVPENQVNEGTFGFVSGADGRYTGCVRKWPGCIQTLDLDDVSTPVDDNNGVYHFEVVEFRKAGTSTMFRGYVISWDDGATGDDLKLSLFYTDDDGSSWSEQEIVASGNGYVTSSTRISTDVEDEFLYIAIDGSEPRVVYWDSSMQVKYMGPVTSGNDWSDGLPAPTQSGSEAIDSSYYLKGDGIYQIRWRFYDSTRGIYSAMSSPLTVSLDTYYTTKASGVVTFHSGGEDSGLPQDGDTLTINGRVYEVETDSPQGLDTTSNIEVDMTSVSTIQQACIALADAINGDTGAEVSAIAYTSSVVIEAKTRGGNANSYAFSISQTASPVNWSVDGSTLTGGGEQTDLADPHCKVTLTFPEDDATGGMHGYAAFSAQFDTVDVFRTVNLENRPPEGAIYYLESTISKASDWASESAWDSLTTTVGSLPDEALVFSTQFNPETDIVAAPPKSGVIARYEGLTFMAEALDATHNGVEIKHSSPEHLSPEYFSTYNKYDSSSRIGRPLRFLRGGASLFSLSRSGIVHIFRSSRSGPLQYNPVHLERGLWTARAAHTAGNSIFMITGMGAVILNGTDGSMSHIAAIDRILFNRWRGDLDDITSAYDGLMNTSYFLNPTDQEILAINHATQSVQIIEGANFKACDGGHAVDGSGHVRAYFVTSTGLICTPDYNESGSGSMLGLSDSYTLDGAATATTNTTTVTDSTATFDNSMIGALLYFATGDNAGLGREITAVNGTSLTVNAFPNTIRATDRYAISPVPFRLRFSPARSRDQDTSHFQRRIVKGIGLISRDHSGTSDAVWRVGIYRNGALTADMSSNTINLDQNPSDAVAHLNLDGITVEPYIEQISTGAMFEVTDMYLILRDTTGRDAADGD